MKEISGRERPSYFETFYSLFLYCPKITPPSNLNFSVFSVTKRILEKQLLIFKINVIFAVEPGVDNGRAASLA